MEKLKERIKEIIQKSYYPNEDGGIEIYTDYRDRELSDKFLYEIMTSDNPRGTFDEAINEWESDYSWEYGEPELFKCIEKSLSDEEKELYDANEEELKEWTQENFYFYYDRNDFNVEVKVNLMLDTGDMNYDFTKNNILNYCASWYGEAGEIPKESSILWLAKQMKKATKLREACRNQYREDGYYVDREKESDPFIESVIQELENLTCHMSTLTFLLKMDLFEYFELREAMKIEKPLFSYNYEDRKGTGYIVVSKDTMCGLFNPWQGGGSVLEIELDKDLKIPVKAIWQAEIETGKSNYGYSVDSVYGLVGSAWNGTVKKICPMKGV